MRCDWFENQSQRIVQPSLRDVGWLPFTWFSMTFSFLSRSAANGFAFPLAKPRSLVLALVCVFSGFSGGARAESDVGSALSPDNFDPVVITGSRFASAADLAPIGATVISASEIRNAGIDNVNEAVRKLAGVYGRQSLYGTDDFDLDMNGFGSASANNLAVFVDGVRISENEQSVALLSTIPIESVARVEIIRSGSSVLYGDGATGGVIQVITKQLGASPFNGSVFTEAGQFNSRVGRAMLAKGGEGFNAILNVSESKTDNYRVNNGVTQKNASLALTWYSTTGRAGLRADFARTDSGLAGSLSLAQFEQDPHQASTPTNSSSLSNDRYTAFIEQTFGTWQVAGELSTREKDTNSVYYGNSRYSGRQTQFTPRLRNLAESDNISNEFVAGLDLINWNRQTNSIYSLGYATQRSRAVYVRDEIRVDQLRVAAGLRREIFDKSSSDPLNSDNYSIAQAVNAWELQTSYAFTPVVNVFAKAGQSYRVANVDDNSLTPIADTALLPQLSHDLEIGTTVGDASRKVTARFFQHDLTNEIYYNPVLIVAGSQFPGANVNLDPTRRRGFAVEGKMQLSQQLRVTAQAQHVNAVFTSGVYQGNEMILVPKNTVSAYLNWVPGDGQTAYLGTQWIDSQRYGGDFLNTCSALIPSHATLDARYSKTFGAWEASVGGTNLANKQYFTNAYACLGAVYPDNGRQLKASLRYSF